MTNLENWQFFSATNLFQNNKDVQFKITLNYEMRKNMQNQCQFKALKILS